MKDTPTPETDAVAYHARRVFGPLEHVVPIDHARKLERQRDTAIAALIELRDAPWLNLPGRAGELIEEAIAAVKGNQP